MRQYYIHIYNNELPNAYRLYYLNYGTEKIYLPEGAKRITRKDAETLARQEAFRQKHSRPHSGLADAAVFPAAYDRDRADICQDSRFFLNEWIWDNAD